MVSVSDRKLLGAVEKESDAVQKIALHLSQRSAKDKINGNIVIMSDGNASAPTDFVSTQHLGIDLAMDRPGFAAGRMSLIVGDSSTGKTTIGYHALAETQKRKGVAIMIDSEYALDPDRAESIGIDPENLIVAEPRSLEACTDTIEILLEEIRRKGSGMENVLFTLLFDSLSGIATEGELDSKKGVAGHSRVFGEAMRRITEKIATSRCALITIGQYRNNIQGFGFGDPKTFLAEKPARFSSSVILSVTARGKVKKSDDIVGITSNVEIRKNKLGAPFRNSLFQVDFENGINLVDGHLSVALKNGIVTKNGGWYVVKGTDIPKFQAYKFGSILKSHPELVKEIVESTGYDYPKDSLVWNPFRGTVGENSDVDIEEIEYSEEETDDFED